MRRVCRACPGSTDRSSSAPPPWPRLPARPCLRAARRRTASPAPAGRRGPAAVAKVEPAQLLVRFATPSRAAVAVTAARDTPVAALPGGVEVVGLQRGETVASKVRQYAKRADVLYAEPNALVHASGLPTRTTRSSPSSGRSRKSTRSRAGASSPARSGPSRPRRRSRSSTRASTRPTPTSRTRDTADGANCINALDACVGGPALDNDPIGHGTHVAGIVGALTDNGTGVAGLAFASPLIPVKVLRSDEQGTVAVGRERDPLGGRPRRAGDQPQPLDDGLLGDALRRGRRRRRGRRARRRGRRQRHDRHGGDDAELPGRVPRRRRRGDDRPERHLAG